MNIITLLFRMYKYSNLKLRMKKCKEKVINNTQKQKKKIIMLKKRRESNLTEAEYQEMEREKEYKRNEEVMKNAIKGLVKTLSKNLCYLILK